MKKINSKVIASRLNKELWRSLTSKDLITENHCEKLFLLRNIMSDQEMPFTMDASMDGEAFTGDDELLLNKLCANIGNIFYLSSEIGKSASAEDYETCELLQGILENAISDNVKFGKKHPIGIEIFYSQNDRVHLKCTDWFILDHIIMHKCGIILDMSVNPPDFL